MADWIDPNDKTQKQFLPHIGEPVWFCHKGKTYFGKHTGGNFKAGQGVSAKYFDTWECRWMYPPAAYQPEKATPTPAQEPVNEAIEAIKFAIKEGIGASVFLNEWLHGDTTEWPEFGAKLAALREKGGAR